MNHLAAFVSRLFTLFVLFWVSIPSHGCFRSTALDWVASYDPNQHVLQIKVPELLPSCNITEYEVKLLTNSTVVDVQNNTTLPCIEGEDFFMQHSLPKHLQRDEWMETEFIEFHHVYSGLYCIHVTPRIDYDSRHILKSTSKFLQSPHQAPDVGHWNTTFSIEPLPHKRAIQVRFTPAPPDFEFHKYEVTLLFGVTNCQETYKGLPVLGEVEETKSECIFTDLKPGAYCVLVRPLDERCIPGTVWRIHDDCTVHSNLVILHEPSPRPTLTVKLPTDISLPALCGGTASFLLLLFLLTSSWAWKKRRRPTQNSIRLRIERRSEVPDIEIRIDQTQGPEVDAPISNTISVRTYYSSPVLLLYTRDNEEHCEAAEKLRMILQSNYFQVYDYYDEEQFDAVAVNPPAWITSLIRDAQTRVVLICSPKSVRAYNTLFQRETDDCDDTEDDESTLFSVNEHPYDSLFLLGLQTVVELIGGSSSLYRSVFVVRFDKLAPSIRSFDGITPFRNYTLPQHMQTLINHLRL